MDNPDMHQRCGLLAARELWVSRLFGLVLDRHTTYSTYFRDPNTQCPLPNAPICIIHMDLTTNRVTCRLTLDLVGLGLVSTLYSPENSRALRQGQPRSLTECSTNVLTCYGPDKEALSGLPSLPQTDIEASDFRLMLQLE